MALENLTNTINPLNNGTIWDGLPPEILTPFTRLIAILQIAGVVVLIYILFLLIKGILTWKRNKKINITYEKILEMDKKLDELLNKTTKRERKIEKLENKPGLFSKLFKKNKKKKVKKK